MLQSNLEVQMRSVSTIKPARRNARTHSKSQISQIARSIERFGFTNPVLLGDDDVIVAGHGRVEAARLLCIGDVPCLYLHGMSEADRRAYMLADNKLALKAGWDMEILALELGELQELDFEMDLTGFDLPEIDAILCEADAASTETVDASDDCPELPADKDVVSRLGDTWKLGRHMLVCGDAKDPEVIGRLMGGDRAAMVFTDPPYNVPITGHVCGMGKQKHREFAEASGEMTSSQFEEFLRVSFENLASACSDGAIIFTCMDWRHLREALGAGHAAFTELKNICVWSKTNGGMGTFYRSQHEMVLAWKVGKAPHTNNFGLGDKGRYRTNVWSYAGVNTFRAGRMDELASHPTVKPVALVADAIRDVSHRGQLVLDTFGGSGTTLVAAEKTGRVARLVEIDPVYCDVIIRRWQTLTGKNAVLGGTDDSHEQVAERRFAAGHSGWGDAA
ncbi:site-specific DNA-methyltransferase [Sphingomicrobium clamense]|uniref:site-specific DNA-methyltransferase (adenine-specific) n=1 Tax=Sphingomicrobium clamense TaxID=2851013 RepID=A0ABS6V873_9SPHN|nr:DNA methyltransferase [Sphingomicrobium sp. B8]MBW0145782.1 ParB N-terminal domain-containing protein [Sphingomicrobium sp. B8]